MPKIWSAKRERQYQHIKESERKEGRSEKVAEEIVSLPMFPTLTSDQQQVVISEVKEFVDSAQLQPAERL